MHGVILKKNAESMGDSRGAISERPDLLRSKVDGKIFLAVSPDLRW